MIDLKDYISDLDTKRFGFKVAKINSFKDSPKKIVEGLRKNGVKLVISRISVEELFVINSLENMGFKLKDIQLKYRHDLSQSLLDTMFINKDITIRTVNKQDIPELVAITRDSFVNYGHYSNNERLDKNVSLEIYCDWILRCCEDKQVADIVFVAVRDNAPVGYLSYKISHASTISR